MSLLPLVSRSYGKGLLPLERAYFPQDTKDTEWLRVAGANGWLVVSRDKNIRRRPGERQSIIENNVGCFYLTQKQHSTRWEYLKLLCQTLDEMERLFRDTPRPFIFGLDRSGQFRPVYPPASKGCQQPPGGP